MVLVLLEVGERNLEDAALESIVGVLETSSAVYESLSDAVDYMSTNFSDGMRPSNILRDLES